MKTVDFIKRFLRTGSTLENNVAQNRFGFAEFPVKQPLNQTELRGQTGIFLRGMDFNRILFCRTASYIQPEPGRDKRHPVHIRASNQTVAGNSLSKATSQYLKPCLGHQPTPWWR